MSHVVPVPATPSVPVVGAQLGDTFPVHRIYCVGRNYVDHAIEMGHSGREAPFFFMKPADAVLPVAEGTLGQMHYPSVTKDLHHEVELVVAIGRGGRNIPAASALEHVYGYAVGLDMTRRDLQGEAKKQGRPWCSGKGFDESAPIGPVRPAAQCNVGAATRIELKVNDSVRQHSVIGKLIWSIPEIIEQLSALWELAPGDLIFTGTPEGVAAVVAGDTLSAQVDGVGSLQVRLVAR
ncbi:fumarylacetoacetate hydrolase family protein [Rhizobacter sp. SG703]|uniref:fumarylacetoacetate hydrolase family protein n=1 Tax=Rhizobacter sp. SG703 TaxID=2587140 RepID=UPI0014450A82|nr:fumarylacetoacetate hydrolase family protein [Rhizobacter sp. SG703]NKI92650.1 fumarylpyruvate hydrolase [Rhizobacter sp. SG703]